MTLVLVNSVVIEEKLYPRQKVDEQHARAIASSMKAGFNPPPIIIEQETLRLVDGRHRLLACTLAGFESIEATLKVYASDADLFHEAVVANSTHGKSLGQYDRIKVAELGFDLGLTEDALATAMRTSIEHLRAISKRYAVTEDNLGQLRKVPLKASTRHFINRHISNEQADAINGAPGASYLLLVNQLISGIEFNLIPPVEESPHLWGRLRELRALIAGADIPPNVANPN